MKRIFSLSEIVVLIWFYIADATLLLLPKSFYNTRLRVKKWKMVRVCCYKHHHLDMTVPIGIRSAILLYLFSRFDNLKHDTVTWGACRGCVAKESKGIQPEPTIQDTIHTPQNGKYRRDTAMDIALRYLSGGNLQ